MSENIIKYEMKVYLKKVGRLLKTENDGGKQEDRSYKMMTASQGNDFIARCLKEEKIFMACRLGSSETGGVVFPDRKLMMRRHRERIRIELCFNAGFYPDEVGEIVKYSQIMKESFGQVDCLAAFGWNFEDYLINKYMAHVKIMEPEGLEPWYSNEPWSKQLSGKKVLVIHPFAQTIQSQYEKRKEIFPGRPLLPQFDLLVFKAVQTIAGEKDVRFASWFDALEWMFQECMKIYFDVAIIGCGAYGFPLAAMIKRAGRSAIHLGGATQLMFGIKGKRWDELPEISKLYNESWVRPGDNERPRGAVNVEGGCYW